jgi:hypothetical protein
VRQQQFANSVCDMHAQIRIRGEQHLKLSEMAQKLIASTLAMPLALLVDGLPSSAASRKTTSSTPADACFDFRQRRYF